MGNPRWNSPPDDQAVVGLPVADDRLERNTHRLLYGSWRLAAPVGLALSLAACGAPPESRVALSEPGEAAYDERLAGKWYWAEGDVAFYLHITPGRDSALLDVLGVVAGYADGESVRLLQAVAHASEIDGETYYNVKRVAGADDTAEGEQPGYILLRVEFEQDGKLALCFLGDVGGRAINDLVDEGRIKGRKVKGDYQGEKTPYSVIDMPRSELIAPIREAGPDRLFPCMDEPFVRLLPIEKSSD